MRLNMVRRAELSVVLALPGAGLEPAGAGRSRRKGCAMSEPSMSAKAARLKNLEKRRARQPYTSGWKAPWGKKGWGTFGDGHCKLAKLAKKLEGELLEDYVATTRGEQRAVWRAARFQAIAEMMLAQVNGEERVIVSRSTKPAAVAERILSRLRKRTDMPTPTPSTPAELLAAIQRETASDV